MNPPPLRSSPFTGSSSKGSNRSRATAAGVAGPREKIIEPSWPAHCQANRRGRQRPLGLWKKTIYSRARGRTASPSQGRRETLSRRRNRKQNRAYGRTVEASPAGRGGFEGGGGLGGGRPANPQQHRGPRGGQR